MSDKIPTAEDFIKNEYELENVNEAHCEPQHIIFMMKAFTKLHVEAALKAASKKATIWVEDGFDEGGHHVDEESILTAYPINLIK